MGDSVLHAEATMRTVVLFGIAIIAVACVSDASGISFDDLVSQVEEHAHPKPKKTVEVDPDMAEWSTDHLLGLDQPPPSHIFDSLISRVNAKQKGGCARKSPPKCEACCEAYQ